jgi:hypothetical protein
MVAVLFLFQVAVTLAPPHMLKLCRNAFATLRVFQSPKGTINYQYVEDLVAYQDKIGLKLSTKVQLNQLMIV